LKAYEVCSREMLSEGVKVRTAVSIGRVTVITWHLADLSYVGSPV
jgi:hypothetical protein